MSPDSFGASARGLGYRGGPEAGAEAAKGPASAIRDDRLAEGRQAVANLGRLVLGDVGFVGQVPGVQVVHRLPPPPSGGSKSSRLAAILAGGCANWVAQCRAIGRILAPRPAPDGRELPAHVARAPARPGAAAAC